MPEADSLHTLRVAIDTQSHRLKRVLRDAGIRKHFLGGVGDGEEKTVKAFIKGSSENALKRKPKVSYSWICDVWLFIYLLIDCGLGLR